MLPKFSKLITTCTFILIAGAALAQSSSSSNKNDGKQTKLAALKNAASAANSDTPNSKASADRSTSKADVLTQYRIGEQDVLNITVWREPELSGAVMVRPDGMITLPLVNDIHAAGLTPDELKDLLTEKLRSFLNLPQVTVAVREINSRKVFVLGQVGHEGSYRINSTTTVLQVIAEAGGLREFANKKGIYVLRNENGSQVRMHFNYEKVVRGQDPNAGILLRPGDTIVIP